MYTSQFPIARANQVLSMMKFSEAWIGSTFNVRYVIEIGFQGEEDKNSTNTKKIITMCLCVSNWYDTNNRLMHDNSNRLPSNATTLPCLFFQQKNTKPSDGENHDAGVYWD